ncbi:hypothetical protein M3S_J41 [Sorghum bicolor]|nr:hypothetical protein M3S_J41 [Sorghum bicolor]
MLAFDLVGVVGIHRAQHARKHWPGLRPDMREQQNGFSPQIRGQFQQWNQLRVHGQQRFYLSNGEHLADLHDFIAVNFIN